MVHSHRKLLSRRRFLALAGGALGALATGFGEAGAQDEPEVRQFVPALAADGPLPGPTLAEMAGGAIMLGFRGTELTPDNPIVADLRERHLGGVILFSFPDPITGTGRNIASPEQVRELCAALQAEAPGSLPLLIAADQEGGQVARLGPAHGFPATPSAAALGAIGDPTHTRAVATGMAETLATAGITLNLAPVVDLAVNPDNTVIYGAERSYGADPSRVVAQARAFIEGMHAQGVLTALKHFPGHGSSFGDTHAGFTDVTATWARREMQPYKELIAAGLADAVLMAHIFNANLDPSYPASLSRNVVQGLLRDELGFGGVAMTDDMQMGAITQQYGFRDALRLALLAGNDLLLYGNTGYDPDLGARVHGTILALVQAGDVPEQRVAQAYSRVQALRKRLA